MHLKPPSIWDVPEVTRNKGARLEKNTPANEHKETVESNEVVIWWAASTGRWVIIDIWRSARQKPDVIK